MPYDHNDVYNSSGPASAGFCAPPVGPYGNISADPMFRSPATGDYTLLPGSPAIDSGQYLASLSVFNPGFDNYDTLPFPTTDVAGNNRFQDATGLGYAAVDMGAYEAPGNADTAQTFLTLTPDVYNQAGTTPIHVSAHISSPLGVPVGTITFYSDDVAFATVAIDANGNAVTDTHTLAPGIHILYAKYGGQGVFSSTDAPAFDVAVDYTFTQLTLSSSENPALVGDNITFTVTSSLPSMGPINLTDNGTPLATLTTDSTGNATYSTSSLTVSTHTITAAYAGNGSTIGPSSATVNQIIFSTIATTATLTSSVNPSTVGQSVTFSALIFSAYQIPPGGSVTFLDGAKPLATVPLDYAGNAQYVYTNLSAGNHNITVTYPATGIYQASSATLVQQVYAYASAAALNVTPTFGPWGTNVSMSVSVTLAGTASGPPPSAPPSGTVTLTDYGTALATVPLVNGAATYSTTTLPPGTGSLGCTYSGDALYTPSTCNSVPVDLGATQGTVLSITGAPNPAPAYSASPITFTSVLKSNGTPVGGEPLSVTFDGQLFCQQVTKATGVSTCKYNGYLDPGQYTVVAEFAGDNTYGPSTATVIEVVSQAPSTTALTVSPTAGPYGTTIAMSATVSVNPNATIVPTGSVTFSSNGTALATVPLNTTTSTASYSTAALAPGTDTISCTYSGDANFTASSCNSVPVSITSAASSLTLSSSANPSPAVTPITFTATLGCLGQPQANAQIVFTIDGNPAGTGQTNGQGTATYTSPGLVTGSHAILASFAGTTDCAASSAQLSEVVNVGPSTTGLMVSPTSGPYGTAVTMNATVSVNSSATVAPGGMVAFSSNGGPLATVPLSNNTASYTTGSLPPGTDTITCTYSGDANFAPSNCNSVPVSITAAASSLMLSSSANPSTVFTAITFYAALTGNGAPLTGAQVVFAIDTSLSTATTNAQGVASVSSPGLSAGKHVVTATFAGNADFGPVSATLTETINVLPSTSTLTVTPASSPYGKSIGMTASVTGAPATNNVPTGMVTFSSNGVPLATVPLTNGTASYATTSLAPGTDTITCTYSGDINFALSNCNGVAATVTASASTLTLTPSANPAQALTPITFTATLSGNGAPLAGASVAFTVDGQTTGSATTNAQGAASYLSPGLSAGTHSVTASFGGNTDYTAVTSTALLEQVVPNATATTLTSYANPSPQGSTVTYSISVTALQGAAAPYGKVTLLDGTTPLAAMPVVGNGTVSGATVQLATLAPGQHSLQAVYTPSDGNFLASASAVLAEIITPVGLTLATDPPSMTLETEHYGYVVVSVISLGGYSGTVQLGCGAALPPSVSCTFDATQVNLPAYGTVSTRLLVNTDAVPFYKASLQAPKHGGPARIMLAGLLPVSLLSLLGLARKRKRGFGMPAVLCGVLGLFLLGTSIGCGSQFPNHTPPGTYSLPITATGPATATTPAQSFTLNLSLTVTP